MAKIYHYTNINTLALILQNRTIRFNRLDCVDDPDEFDFEHEGLSPAVYFYTSCWTRNENESLPQWSMYGHNNHGVRIGLEEDMFELFEVRGRMSFLPEEENLRKNDFVILPNLSDNQSSITDIVYVDDPTVYRSDIVGKLGGRSFVNFRKLGLYKSKDWGFQKECRITITILPKIGTRDDRYMPIQYALEHNIQNDFTYYDLGLKNDVYQNMEIMLGPSTSLSEKLIVKSLMLKYLNREDCQESKYTGKTK